MAIFQDTELSTDDENVFRINNGDLQALKKLQDVWNFKDAEAVVAFAIGVLRQADGSKRIYVFPEGSNVASPVTPNDSLLNQHTETSDEHRE